MDAEIKQRPKKQTLPELAEQIQRAQKPITKYGERSRTAADIVIEQAFLCGQYLREAKKLAKHGEFQRWVKKEAGLEKSTAQRYMRLHEWRLKFPKEKFAELQMKPHTLRQLYLLAGILPEDEDDKDRGMKGSSDDLARLRRLVRKVTREANAHRDYADAKDLQKALAPLVGLLEDVGKDIPKASHVTHLDSEN